MQVTEVDAPARRVPRICWRVRQFRNLVVGEDATCRAILEVHVVRQKGHPAVRLDVVHSVVCASAADVVARARYHRVGEAAQQFVHVDQLVETEFKGSA